MLNELLNAVRNSVQSHSDQQANTGFDPTNLLSHIGDLFQQHAAQTGQVLPAGQDPYGDPGGVGGGRFGNVRPASEDPYGDPADQGR